MAKNNEVKAYFLVKENEIIPFSARLKEGNLCVANITTMFDKGDMIIAKISDSPPLASINIVVDSFADTKSKSTIVIYKGYTDLQIKDIRSKLKEFNKHIHASDVSQEIKDLLLAKSAKLEAAVGTNKFDKIMQEFMGLFLEYEQYLPAIFEFLHL